MKIFRISMALFRYTEIVAKNQIECSFRTTYCHADLITNGHDPVPGLRYHIRCINAIL